jgi:hypothetical protein
MSKEEQQAARDKRREQGIPTRNVSGITSQRNVSKSNTVQISEDSEQRMYDTEEAPQAIAKSTTFRVSSLAQLQPTSKPKTYQGPKVPPKASQLNNETRIQLLEKELQLLREQLG